MDDSNEDENLIDTETDDTYDSESENVNTSPIFFQDQSNSQEGSRKVIWTHSKIQISKESSDTNKITNTERNGFLEALEKLNFDIFEAESVIISFIISCLIS